jgi:hypothetical protein
MLCPVLGICLCTFPTNYSACLQSHVDNSSLQRHLDALDIVGPNGKDIIVGHLISKFFRLFVEGKYSASQVESALGAII